MSTPPRTRLAPSPTGALHLGNARTFLINWALALQNGWKVVLRIEDLDSPRVKPEANQQTLDTLQWLGLTWDEGPFYQQADLTPYHHALHRLAGKGLIYPCQCTRKEIEAAQSAPHADEHELRYPGLCRPDAPRPATYEPTDPARATAWRLHVPDKTITFTDRFAGPQSSNVQRIVGDFVVATKSELPAYQLAAVVDDAAQGITHIIRGDDLITSTPRQMLLYRLLDLTPQPEYYHLPLVLGADGHRLAKRHGDTRLTTYREQGVTPERVIGLLAHWSGLGPLQEMDAPTFAQRFDLDKLSHEPVVYTPQLEAWLLEAATCTPPPKP